MTRPDFHGIRRVLVTGGAGFIGGALIRRLLQEPDLIIYNLDKLGYASDLTSIQNVLDSSPSQMQKPMSSKYQLLEVNLADAAATLSAVEDADPDLVIHLAAESHVDRSIDSPLCFVESNILGTYNLLQAVRMHWQGLPSQRRDDFRFHHVSTDEVFGTLGSTGCFCETTAYDPRSPYSATKAASDHLVNAWYHTYGLPTITSNCSNNYGPWQFPEKLIPVVILKALSGEPIPLYGDGSNVRDWLHVEDHVDALLLVATLGKIGESYCIGGAGAFGSSSERTNLEVVTAICNVTNKLFPQSAPHERLIRMVSDRPGHDQRYAINSSKICQELGWRPRYSFESGIEMTVNWYVSHQQWCHAVREKANYRGERIGG